MALSTVHRARLGVYLIITFGSYAEFRTYYVVHYINKSYDHDCIPGEIRR